MVILKETIRRLEDASMTAPRESVSIARSELIRSMIQDGCAYQDLVPHERNRCDDYLSEKLLFDCTGAGLRAKIRRLD